MERLVPKDHGEEVAVFRSQVIGPLVHRALTRGELSREVAALSKRRFRLPGAAVTRCYSVPTLLRWYRRFRKGGLAALVPRPRKDRGHAKALDPQLRELVLAVRRAHATASAQLIVRTLEEKGRLTRGLVSASTVRRLLRDAGLDRTRLRDTAGHVRLRWEASHAGALWQGDVCHGPVIGGDGRWIRPKIHALMDDRSRYVVALEVRESETEEDMLAILVATIRRSGRPDGLYLDNGATYIGAALALACARLGMALIHPKAHDPEARGKIERFWRSLREKCLDYLPRETTLAELQQRLDIFLSKHYQHEPHEGLFGDTPASVWETRQTQVPTEAALAGALTAEKIRRVTKDGVVTIDGRLFEVRQGFLAGHRVKVRSCLVAGLAPVAEVEHDGRRYQLKPLDRAANGSGRRPAQTREAVPAVPFDPTAPDESR